MSSSNINMPTFSMRSMKRHRKLLSCLTLRSCSQTDQFVSSYGNPKNKLRNIEKRKMRDKLSSSLTRWPSFTPLPKHYKGAFQANSPFQAFQEPTPQWPPNSNNPLNTTSSTPTVDMAGIKEDPIKEVAEAGTDQEAEVVTKVMEV